MWGLSFVFPIVALILKRFHEGGTEPDTRAWIVLSLVTVWALRLAFHIGLRHKGEDFRYQDFRRNWTAIGGYWGYLWRTFFIIFMMQGLFSLINNSAALYVEIYSAGTPLIWSDYLGIAVWLFGFLFEWIGDE